ncbi:MarR family winged helix-turn-helix transcriptional regulator [Paenibacillus turpanensis]|uniref:MarR family winged helix-turn-helix transcriptional regulator n=1 Tax=Paenibacillus turpanensis TaxID=2689078 RepID=UPI00140E963C|nr:MarR family transcriptional regulator [Paenibacillus turpanensis]
MYAVEFAKLWHKLSKEMKHHMESSLSPSLTESQLVVLEFIMNNDRVKPSDLIEFLSTTPAAVTTLIDRMEKNELIVRERDSQDRRIVWIHLTDKGLAEGKRGLEIRQQYLQDSLSRISAHNQQVLIYLLGKIAHEKLSS